jgi:hypothetical protein
MWRYGVFTMRRSMIMSVDLFALTRTEPDTHLGFSTIVWFRILALAEAYGWEPTGTEAPPDDPSWNGNYTSNDAQVVTETDARQLAEALERALRKMPADDHMNSPDWQDAIRDVIALARLGPFAIY